MSYFDISGAVFNNQLRELETSDPAHADVFNAVFRQLINNDVALMEAASMFAGEKNKQAEFILNLKRTGKKYGVHHSAFDVSPLSAGTRTFDAVGMVAQPSTNTVRGRNDFEGESVFYGLEVNGHVDDAGEFIVEYIKGIDNEFSRTERDTWMLYLTQWINITIDANGESLVISDEHHAGFFPEGAAIRTDQTVRPFVAQAKYMAGNGSDGKAASISRVNAAHDQSHNGMITRFKAKGTQYCGTTAQDKNHMDNLFEVAFATRNSQSIMSGCTSYYNRFYATVVENDVERIIISKSDANYLVVGSTVSIGNATALSGNNPTDDRSNAGLHAKANRVIITKIEDYDSNNSAVYVDNGGTKFSTGSTMVGSTEVKTTIVTMPWHTGACDNVLGSCGSPNSNTSGKDPYILFGVEMFLGFYEVISNVILKISNHVMTACICYDCTKLATSVTSDYVECGYSIADTQESWKYISELGYDPENPSVRHGTKVAASSSTGYADGQYTNKLDQTSDGLREWLSGGYLGGGSNAGRWCANLANGLGNSWWHFAARISVRILMCSVFRCPLRWP